MGGTGGYRGRCAEIAHDGRDGAGGGVQMADHLCRGWVKEVKGEGRGVLVLVIIGCVEGGWGKLRGGGEKVCVWRVEASRWVKGGWVEGKWSGWMEWVDGEGGWRGLAQGCLLLVAVSKRCVERVHY